MRTITNVDSVDRERFRKQSSHVPQAVSAMQSDEAFADLLTDSFGLLYKYQPLIRDEVDTDRQLNHHILTEMSQLAEYKRLRTFTKGDAANAAGALGLVKSIWDSLPASVREAQKSCEGIEQQIQDALESDEYDPSVLEQLYEDASGAEEQLEGQLDEWRDAIRQAVRRVLAQADSETAETEQAVSCLGWSREGGKLEQAPAGDKMRISKALKNNRQLQEIIRMAGRMSNIAQKKQRQKAQYLRTEVVGIEQGDDLSAVIPSEFGNLVHGDAGLRALFLKKFSQAELLQYELESREPKAQGPVLVAIDCSGSMSGEPDTWSKACALAMYSIARKQQRDFGILLFNHRITNEIFIPKGQHQPQQLIQLLTAGVGGGTSFEEPLGRACDLIRTSKHSKADLIVITDGCCDISADFKARYDADKRELEFSCYTILIGGSEYERKVAAKFSDTVNELHKMLAKNEGAAFDVVFSI